MLICGLRIVFYFRKEKYDYFRIIDNVFKRYELNKIRIYKYFWR